MQNIGLLPPSMVSRISGYQHGTSRSVLMGEFDLAGVSAAVDSGLKENIGRPQSQENDH
jgi:hypothetical protein